jgi:hypothetical protein
MSHPDSIDDRTPAWWYAAAVLIGLFAAAILMGGGEEIPPPRPTATAPAVTTPYKEWQVPEMPVITATPTPPAVTEEDGEFIVDPSVAAAEEEERNADPYEINEALVMPDETGRVQPSYADIVTAAEEEPEAPKDGSTEEAAAP